VLAFPIIAQSLTVQDCKSWNRLEFFRAIMVAQFFFFFFFWVQHSSYCNNLWWQIKAPSFGATLCCRGQIIFCIKNNI
jgi:hypothetical protein